MTQAPAPQIRDATASDVEAIAALRDAVAQTSDSIGTVAVAPVVEHLLLVGIVADGGAALVADADGEIVGHLLLQRSPQAEATTAEIALFVAEQWRGRGLGRSLIDAATQRARAAGYSRLDLQVLPGNDAAVALYRSAGFVAEAQSDMELVGRRVLLMSLDLTAG